MNIVLEGVDAAGKTTLSKKLEEKLHMMTVKGSSFELARCQNSELFLHFKKLNNADNIIIDRNIWSNRVYSTLYQDYTILTPSQRMFIEEKIKDKTILVYLHANEDTIINRLEERGDEYITTDKVADILGMYRTTIDDTRNNGIFVLEYDTGLLDLQSFDDIAESVVEATVLFE